MVATVHYYLSLVDRLRVEIYNVQDSLLSLLLLLETNKSSRSHYRFSNEYFWKIFETVLREIYNLLP